MEAAVTEKVCMVVHIPIGDGVAYTATLCSRDLLWPHTSVASRVTCPDCLRVGQAMWRSATARYVASGYSLKLPTGS